MESSVSSENPSRVHSRKVDAARESHHVIQGERSDSRHRWRSSQELAKDPDGQYLPQVHATIAIEVEGGAFTMMTHRPVLRRKHCEGFFCEENERLEVS
jgi:hypothetical protein